MAWFLGQSLLFIVLAFVLGLLVGWLIWGRRRVVQLSFSSGAGSSSSVASVPAPAAAPDIESEPAAMDSTVDFGASPTVEEVQREPALAGAGGSSRGESLADSEAATVVLPYGKDVFRSDESAFADADASAEGDRTSGSADDDAFASASAADTAVLAVADEPERAASAVDEQVPESRPAAEPEPTTSAADPAAEPEPLAVAEPEPEPVAEVEPEPEPLAVSEPEPESAPEVEPEPVLLGAAASSAAATGGGAVGADDDLKRIEGIGPKMAAALHTAGIRTFRQLADTDEPTLRAAIQAAGLRFAPSLVTWARQAKLLADGDEDGFNALTKQLIAGREARRG